MLLSSRLLMGSAPLTPTERRVPQLLLTKATEKEIAQQVEVAAIDRYYQRRHQYLPQIPV